MSAPGLRGGKMRIHGETPPPSLVSHLLAGEELIERDRPVLGPEPARRPEVGYAALRRNAGASEGSDDAGAIHQFLQMIDGGLQIRRDHICFLSSGFFCQAMQRGHTMRYLHTMLRVRNL